MASRPRRRSRPSSAGFRLALVSSSESHCSDDRRSVSRPPANICMLDMRRARCLHGPRSLVGGPPAPPVGGPPAPGSPVSSAVTERDIRRPTIIDLATSLSDVIRAIAWRRARQLNTLVRGAANVQRVSLRQTGSDDTRHLYQLVSCAQYSRPLLSEAARRGLCR